MRRVEQLRTADIASLKGRRKLCDESVAQLAESIASMGLQTPITVRIVNDFVDEDGVIVDGQPILVTGAHRLAAAKSLGWEKIECFVMDDGDEIDAQLWEIAENLHRAELTAMERAHQIAEWVRLTDEKRAQVSAQVAPKPQGGRPESGIRAASRELGIDRDQARRAIQIDSIAPEAKEAARQAGIDNNQSALLRVARADNQADEVGVIVKERAASAKYVLPEEDQQWNALMSAWERATILSVRKRWIAWVSATA